MNLVFAGGKASLDEMIASTEHGLLVSGFGTSARWTLTRR